MCGICHKKVSEQENGVQCEICSHWYHCKCQDVSEALYKVLNLFTTDIHWFCKGWSGGAEKVFGFFAHLQSRVDILEEEMCRMHKESQEQIQRVTEECENKMESTKTELLCVIDDRMDELKKSVGDNLKDQEPKWSDIVSKGVDD